MTTYPAIVANARHLINYISMTCQISQLVALNLCIGIGGGDNRTGGVQRFKTICEKKERAKNSDIYF